jgi:Xaa-Pro dipeptidase
MRRWLCGYRLASVRRRYSKRRRNASAASRDEPPMSQKGRTLRRERLAALMAHRQLDAVVLRRPVNFAWYTAGADSRVDHYGAEGVADLIVTPDAERVLTNAIEAPRMRAEQVPRLDVVEHPWDQDRNAHLRELLGAARVGADVPLAGTSDVAADVAALRRVLDFDAIDQLRAVGADVAAAVEEAAGAVLPGVDERSLAATLAAACRARGLTAPVLLVGADERIARYRHPLPVGATVQRRALLAVSAERGGLYANLTRIVELEEPDPELRRRCEAAQEILARMRDEATRRGRTLADAFSDCRRFYADAGFPDEWRLHHQGGSTGYVSREVIATPTTTDPIEVGMAFAWNPSITGAKAEETFLLGADGPELIAANPTEVAA